MKVNQISKKIFFMVFFALCFSVSFTFLSNNISTQTTDTEQTVQAAVTKITSVSGLKGISGYGEYELGGNIDLSGKIWTPISNFYGTLDGKGYEITGLTIDTSISGYAGLFSDTSATLKNIILRNVNIVSNSYAGALAGKASGTITGCASFGSISGSGGYKGGLVGYLGSSASIRNSYSYANVSGGALAGLNYGTIERCFFAGVSSSSLSGTNCHDYANGSEYSYPSTDDWYSTTDATNVYPGAKKILKGVGNIFIEMRESVFNGKEYPSSTIALNSGKEMAGLYKFTHSDCTLKNKVSNLSYTTKANYTITDYTCLNVIDEKDKETTYAGFTCNPFTDKVSAKYNYSSSDITQAYYRLTVYVRGKLINITSGVKTFSDVKKSSTEFAQYVKISSISYIDASSSEPYSYYSYYTSSPSTSYGSSCSFYRPYGESYTVTFTDKKYGDYLSQVYDGRYGTSSSSCSGSLNKVSYNSYTTSVSAYSTSIYHFFDNVFSVKITSDNTIDSCASDWKSNYNGKSKYINIMLYESISSKGYSYNGGNKLTSIDSSSALYPVYSKFICKSIKTRSSGIKLFENNGSYGDSLSGTTNVWTGGEELVPEWGAVNQETTITNENISTVAFYSASTTSSSYLDVKTSKTAENKNTVSYIKSNTQKVNNIILRITPSSGYKLTEIILTSDGNANGSSYSNITTLEVSKSVGQTTFKYYGCGLAKKASAPMVVNSYKVSYSSGVYTVTFANLVGINNIKFVGEETAYQLKIVTNIDSTLKQYNYKPLKVLGGYISKSTSKSISKDSSYTEINSTTGYSAYISYVTSLVLTYDVKTGYDLAGTITSPSGLSIAHTIDRSAKTIRLDLSSVTNATEENVYELEINLKRSTTNFVFQLDGNVDLTKVDRSWTFGLNYEIDGKLTKMTPYKRNTITANNIITTDTTLNLVFYNLPFKTKITVNNVTIDGLNNAYYSKDRSESGSTQTIKISNLLIDTTRTVNVNIEFIVGNTNVTVTKNVNGIQMEQKTMSVPYGAEIKVINLATSKLGVYAYGTDSSTLASLTFGVDFTDKEVVISYAGVVSSTFPLDSNSWQYTTYINENSNNIVLDYEQKGLNVTVAETYIANGSDTIGEIKNATSNHRYIQYYEEVSGQAQVGYDLIGYYYVLKETSGTPAGDYFYKSGTFSTNSIFKYILGTSKDGYTTISIEEKVLYIVKVYQAKKYTAKFNITIADPVQDGRELTVTLDKTSSIVLEYGKYYECQSLPIATIDGMYDFSGWKSGTNAISYGGQYSGKFTLTGCKFTDSFVEFDIQYTAKKVEIHYFYKDDLEKRLTYNTATTYGTNTYSLPTNPTRLGYKFVGWKYLFKSSDKTIDSNNNKNQSRDRQTYISVSDSGAKTQYKFDIESTNVNFYAEWETIDVEITFTAGGLSDYKGKFPDGATEHKGSFKFGTTNFKFSDGFSFENSNWQPVWENNFGVFEFECFILNSDPTKKYYPQSDNFTYEVSEDDLEKYVKEGYKFVAYYKLVALKDIIPTQFDAWVYNGEAKKIELNFNKNNVLTYSYSWYYNNEQISDAIQNYYNVKNVIESGVYHSVVSAKFNNETVAYGEVIKKSQESNITITPKQLKFTQNGIRTSTLTKMYDNTYQTDTTISFDGVCKGDSISMTAVYSSKDVGKNIVMSSTISSLASSTDVRNYTKDDDILGVITPYEINLTLKDITKNYIVKIGQDAKQNIITEYFQMTETVVEFMQKNSFSPEYVLKTSKNIGSDNGNGQEYKQNNGDYSIVVDTYNVKNGANTNFTVVVLDSFYIKLTDSNSVFVSISAYTNDDPNEPKKEVDSTIATLTFDINRYKEHVYTIDGNGTSQVVISDLKSNFALYPELAVVLNIVKTQEDYGLLYWLDHWEITIDDVVMPTSFTTDDIIYTIIDSNVDQIEIACFVTSLAKISFNYDLADGEEIEEKTKDTKFQIAQTIQHSMDVYGAVLPSPERIGFTFDGWYLGTTKVTEQTIWDRNSRVSPIELVANWILDSVKISEPCTMVNFTYDGLKHSYTVDITNRNDLAIDYWTLSTWESTAIESGTTYQDTLTVKDFVNNGSYTLKINATYRGKTQTATWQIVIKIDKFELLTTTREFTKTYDKRDTYEYAILDSTGSTVAPNGEMVILCGTFSSNQAGAKLQKYTISYYVMLDNEKLAEKYIQNYNLDTDKIDYDKSVIKVKDVTLTFINQTRQYNTKPIVVDGEYEDDLIKFTYEISSNKADVGKYSDALKNLKIDITGDNKSNFKFTLVGTMEITKRLLEANDAYWYKDTNVEFDGNEHKALVKVRIDADDPNSDDCDSFLLEEENYNYYSGNVKLTGLPVLAGEYRVEAVFDNDFYYGTLTTTMIIRQRALKVSDVGEQKINKIYDGTNTVLQGLEQFKIERVVSGYVPGYIYYYQSVYAGEDIPVLFELDQTNKNSANYTINFSSVGDIYHKSIDIKVTAQKQYDGEKYFVVYPENMVVSGVISGEEIEGNIQFAVTDVGLYTNPSISESDIENNLVINALSYNTNYKVDSISYNLNIIKAKMRFYTEVASTYDYCGTCIEFEKVVTKIETNDSSFEHIIKTTFTNRNDSTDTSNTAVTIGDYTVNFTIDDEYSRNFEIIEGQTQFDFTIVKRKILFAFTKTMAYNGATQIYEGENSSGTELFPNEMTQGDATYYNSLGIGDTITWKFETTRKDVGTYFLMNYSTDGSTEGVDVLIHTLQILKDGQDYKFNYEIIIGTEALIEIRKIEVSRKDVILASTNPDVYSAEVKKLVFTVYGKSEPYTIDYNSLLRNDNPVTEIKYAGVYSVSIELNNYIIKNPSPFKYTIEKKEIDIDVFDIVKTYDGTKYVDETCYQMKSGYDFIEYDKDNTDVKVIGEYESSDASTLIPVKFYVYSSSQALSESYELITKNGLGTIEVNKKTLKLNGGKYDTYYDGEFVTILVEYFSVGGVVPASLTLENQEVLRGSVVLPKKDYIEGGYDLSTLSDKIDQSGLSLSSGLLANYKFSFEGIVYLKQAVIEMNVKNLDVVYNAEYQEPTYEKLIYKDQGKITEDIIYSVQYIQNGTVLTSLPKNAGTYTITLTMLENNTNMLSNYTFVMKNTSGVFEYDTSGNVVCGTTITFTDAFTIAKRQIAISVQSKINGKDYVSKTYVEGQNATYKVLNNDVVDPSTDNNNGLLTNVHTLNCVLSTNSDEGDRTYVADFSGATLQEMMSNANELFIYSYEILENGSIDVSKNYELVYVKGKIRIVYTSDSFDTDALNELVYNGEDKITNGEFYVKFMIKKVIYTFSLNGTNTYNGLKVISNLQYDGKDTTSIILAGSYTVDLYIKPPAEEMEPVSQTQFEFTVKPKDITDFEFNGTKEYDGTSTVIAELETNQICSRNGVKDSVTFIGNYLSNGEKVKTVGTNYKIKIEPIGDDAKNYTVSKLFDGEITKRKITLQLNSDPSLIYTNDVQEIPASLFSVISSKIVDGEELAGSVTVLQLNVKTYSFDNKENFNIEKLQILSSDENVIDNYAITISGDYTINPLTIDVEVSTISLTYKGKDLSINDNLTPLVNNNEKLIEVVNKYYKITYYNSSNEVISSETDSTKTGVVDAGNYTAVVSSGSTNVAFNVIDKTNNTISFKVKKRDITLNINETRVYNPTSDYETSFELGTEDGINIAEGQVLKGTYKLSAEGLGVGTYDTNKNLRPWGYVVFEEDSLSIFDPRNPTDTNLVRNYVFDTSANITIDAFEISEENAYLDEDQLIYDKTEALTRLEFVFLDANGDLQTITTDDTTWGLIELIGDSAINVNDEDSPYKVKVTVNNCILLGGDSDGSKVFEFSIIPREITEIEFTSSKPYDATSSVQNVKAKDGQIISGDDIEIIGTYISKENSTEQTFVGTYNILFTLKNKQNYPAKNYNISSEIQETGEITSRNITFKLTKQFVYQSTGEYVIPYDSSLIYSGSLVSGQTLTGNIKLNKTYFVGNVDAKEFDISELTIHDGEGTDTTSNYAFAFANDSTIQIDKAKVKVDFSELENSYIYSANAQNIDLTGRISLTNSTEEVLPELIRIYKNSSGKQVEPKDVGEYSLELTPKLECYEIEGDNTFAFKITKYEWIIEKIQNPPSKYFNSEDPELLCQETSPLGEQVTLYFERTLGESIGKYDMFLIAWDKDNNYDIKLSDDAGKGLFAIKKADTLTIVILNNDNNKAVLQKEYNTKEINSVDIKLLEIEDKNAGKYDSAPYLQSLEGEVYFTSGADVGEYSCSKNNGLQSLYYENIIVECELNFVVTPKIITYSVANAEKAYDGTTEFVETINILDSDGNILDKNTYSLIAQGEYASKDIGKDIEINVSLSGDEISNYKPTTTLVGNIVARKVVIVPKNNQSRIYGEQIGEIEYDISDKVSYKNSFSGNMRNELVVVGTNGLYLDYLDGFTKYVVGSYDILCGFESTNLDISFESKTFEINKKELFITDANNFEKDYDGTPIVNNEGFIYSGEIDGDDVKAVAFYYKEDGITYDTSVGLNKIVKFELVGVDKNNYYVNETTGSIGEKGIKIVYKYTFDGMQNSNLIKDNAISNQSLTYGAKVSAKVDTMPQPKHEGYIFKGWFLSEDFADASEITLDTFIDENIWEVSAQEKTAYAKWEINKYTLVVKIATEVNDIYVISSLGGVTNDITGQDVYSYNEQIDLSSILSPQAKTGYEFIGFSDDVNLATEISSDYTIKANTSGENVIYVKFAPVKVKLTLDANGGIFTKDNVWLFNQELSVAVIEIKFGTSLSAKGIVLPTLARQGYTLSSAGWGTKSGKNTADVPFTVDTILADDYIDGRTLYAVWENDDFVLTLNANGGFYDNFDTDIWQALNWDEKGRATTVSKVIYFDQILGELIYPQKEGWTFTGYSNFVTENYFFSQLENIIADAVYEENEYKLQINSLRQNIDIEILDKDGNLLNKQSFKAGESIYEVDVKTTNQCKITATNTQGYEFKNWSSSYIPVNENSSSVITIKEFLKNETLTANYICKENRITITINDASKGYIEVDGVSKEGQEKVEIYARTESTVSLVANVYEGYTIVSWKYDAGNFGCELSGDDTNSERILSGFVSDVDIEIVFGARENQITVISDEDKGLISTDDGIVNGVLEYTFGVFTEDVLTFTVTAKHGYEIDTNQDNWSFITTSANKGNLNFEFNQTKDICKVTFKNFVSDGEIVIPYLIKQFTLKFVSILENDDVFTEKNIQNLVNITYDGNTTSLDSNGEYTQTYQQVINVVPTLDVQEGYSFSCWSKSPNSEYDITRVEGLEKLYENNSIDLSVQDDMTIYLIYAINEYRVSYNIDDINEGGIETSNSTNSLLQKSFDIIVRYGDTTEEVVVRPSEYFKFDRWVKVEDDGSYTELNGEDYEINGTGLIVKNVKQDANFKALFTGKPITIKISLIVPKEQVLGTLTDFGKLTILENGEGGITVSSGVISSSDKGMMITYTVSSFAGKKLTALLTEENGYTFSYTSPAFSYSSENKTITIPQSTYVDTDVEIFLKAQENKVTIKIIGDNDGGVLHIDYNNTIGLVESVSIKDNGTIAEFVVYTGGSISAILSVMPGFNMLANSYFGVLSPIADSRYKESRIQLGDINSDIVIEVELQAYIYEVTFNFNYSDEQSPENVVSKVKANRTEFDPALGSNVVNPTRSAKWKFVGWSTRADNDTNLIYYFENGNIYYYSYENGTKKMTGFVGSDYATASSKTGVDYECSLYAIWELVTYKVNIVLVPSMATTNILYLDTFPNSEGRKLKIDSQGYIYGVEYEPGALVKIVAPIPESGYTYCGWSYEDGITRQSSLKTDVFEITMPEQDIVVYMYYLVNVEIKTVGGKGEVTLSKQQVLPGETVAVSATPEEGYLFSKWLLNDTEVSDSKDQMNIKIDRASVITCEFVGKEIEVKTQDSDKATLQIISKNQYTEGVFRVGDSVTFGVTNITYGYAHTGWTGEYFGKVENYTYTLTKEDATRGYVLFSPVISAKDVVIEFVVSDINSGYFEIQGERVNNNFQKVYKYDSTITYRIIVEQRYVQTGLKVNDKVLALDCREIKIHTDDEYKFDINGVNKIVVTIEQLLWIDAWSMFDGNGTKENPYEIYKVEQLAAMAYLINNNIEAVGTTPYAKGYYKLKIDMNLIEKFWVPIGTIENPFDGTFDFVDNDVYELFTDKYYEVTHCDGLFGYITENAKILRNKADYTLALILISSIVGAISIAIIIILLWVKRKKKKMEEMANRYAVTKDPNFVESVSEAQNKIDNSLDDYSSTLQKQMQIKKTKPQRKRKM